MPFRKLESQKKSEYVVSQILEAIKAGEYRVGDRLPSEMDIAEMTGVSRPSVREALGALRLVGVIETKNGYGTYVKTENWISDSVKIESQIPSILNQGGNTFEALEARKTVEPAVAELALEMMNKDDSMRIFKAFQQMERGAKKKDYASFHAANKRFHLSIVKATRNNSLINCIKSLLNLFSNSDMGLELRKRYLTEEKYVWNAVEIHRSILENLQNRNAEKLRDAYIEHFVQVEEQLIGR